MAVFISAGVYTQERDDSLYATALSPTIIGLIGTATKGDTNVATLVTSESDLTTAFGLPRTKDLGMHAAIEALKAGRLVYFVRVAGAAATTGNVDALDAGSGATAASIGPSDNGEPFNLISGSTESPVGTRTTQIEITWNNGAGGNTTDVMVAAVQATRNNGAGAATYDLNGIDSGNPVLLTIRVNGDPAQTITFASTDPLISAFNAVTPAEVAAVINDQLIGGEARFSGNVVTVASDRFGSGSTIQVTGGNANSVLVFGTTLASGSGDVNDLAAVTGAELKTVIEADTSSNLSVTVGSGGEITISTATTGSTRSVRIVSAASPLVGAAPLVDLTPLDTTVLGTDSSAAANTIRFSARSAGSHSSDITVTVSDSSALAGTKRLVVRYRGVTVETYDKLFKSPTPVTGGYAMITVLSTGATDGSQPASEFITASDLNASGENPANGTYTLSAGNNGDNWTASTVIGTIVGPVRTGLQLFRNVESLPVNLLATPGISFASVIAEGIDICETRGYALYVADAPIGLSPAEVVQWHNGDSSVTVTVDQEGHTETNSVAFDSSYAALYYPFVQIHDKFNDEDIFIPPSAIVLRTIAFTDQAFDPWFAPAGPVRTQAASVLDLEVSPDQGERDLMQLPGNNVNPIANIRGAGVTIMGQKTLQRTPTALDRVNVRRLLLALERVVAQSVLRLTFEPNDPVMWRRFVNLVSPFLDDVKARRGVYDYRVVADSSTTTPTLINQNTFVGKIFLQPTKAAEILIVSFNLLATGAEFTEAAQA